MGIIIILLVAAFLLGFLPDVVAKVLVGVALLLTIFAALRGKLGWLERWLDDRDP